MKKNIYVLIFLTAFQLQSYCQEKISYASFDYTGEEFSPKMNDHVRRFRNNLSGYLGISAGQKNLLRVSMDTSCLVGTAMIKFKVSANGTLSDIGCTKSVNPTLAKMFKEHVLTSAKYWKAKGDKNLYYILPIHYNFRNKCGDREIKLSTTHSDHLFNFDDGLTIKELPVVLLQSWLFSSGDPENTDAYNLPPQKKN